MRVENVLKMWKLIVRYDQIKNTFTLYRIIYIYIYKKQKSCFFRHFNAEMLLRLLRPDDPDTLQYILYSPANLLEQ